jgi:hypothetical protein
VPFQNKIIPQFEMRLPWPETAKTALNYEYSTAIPAMLKHCKNRAASKFSGKFTIRVVGPEPILAPFRTSKQNDRKF